MPARRSPDALASRRFRAIQRGFLIPHGRPDHNYPEVRNTVKERTRILSTALDTHRICDNIVGRHAHSASQSLANAKPHIHQSLYNAYRSNIRAGNVSRHAPWMDAHRRAWADLCDDDESDASSPPHLGVATPSQPFEVDWDSLRFELQAEDITETCCETSTNMSIYDFADSEEASRFQSIVAAQGNRVPLIEVPSAEFLNFTSSTTHVEPLAPNSMDSRIEALQNRITELEASLSTLIQCCKEIVQEGCKQTVEHVIRGVVPLLEQNITAANTQRVK